MTADELSTLFAALADPTRRAILARLAQGEATVNELAAPLPMSLQAVSKHLKVLERAGLIVRSRDAQWRPCRLEPAGLQTVAAWTEQYRRLWEQRHDALDRYLTSLRPTDTGEAGPGTTAGRPPTDEPERATPTGPPEPSTEAPTEH